MAMNRRDALKSVILMMGGTMVGANVILTGCAPEDQMASTSLDSEILAMTKETMSGVLDIKALHPDQVGAEMSLK